MSHPKRIFSEEDCSTFNKLRDEHKRKILSFSQMLALFGANFKNGGRVLQKLVNEGIITKVRRGYYQFPSEPVYYKVLQAAWSKPEIKQQIKKKTLEDEIEDAILLLCDNGFKVLKKVFDIESALKSPDKTVSSFIRWEEVL